MRANIVYNEDAIRHILKQNKTAMEKQIYYMQVTVSNYGKIAGDLESKAKAEERIAATAMKSESRPSSGGHYKMQVPDTAKRAEAREKAKAYRDQASALRKYIAELKSSIRALENAITDSTSSTNRLIYEVQAADVAI